MRFEMLIPTMLWLAFQSAPAPEARSVTRQAKTLQDADRLTDARDLYEQALQADPGDRVAQEGLAESTERLALAARAAGNNDEALRELLRAQKVAPANTRVLFDLGVLEEQMSLFRDADGTLAILEKESPGEAKVLYAVARVKLDLGQFDAAESHMQAYLKLRPADASAQYGLGNIYLRSASLEKAREAFERSIALQPVQTEAYYQLGQTYLQQDRCAEAETNFAKTLGRDARHGGALAGMGTCYFKQKQFDTAAEWLRKAIEAAPEYQPGHYYLGLTLRRLGNDAESKKELEIATRLAEEDSRRGANRLRLTEPNGAP